MFSYLLVLACLALGAVADADPASTGVNLKPHYCNRDVL